MCVSSANAYSPCAVSDSQLRVVHISTSAIPLLACKSGPLLGFGGDSGQAVLLAHKGMEC